jgi:hypothetical protein
MHAWSLVVFVEPNIYCRGQHCTGMVVHTYMPICQLQSYTMIFIWTLARLRSLENVYGPPSPALLSWMGWNLPHLRPQAANDSGPSGPAGGLARQRKSKLRVRRKLSNAPSLGRANRIHGRISFTVTSIRVAVMHGRDIITSSLSVRRPGRLYSTPYVKRSFAVSSSWCFLRWGSEATLLAVSV